MHPLFGAARSVLCLGIGGGGDVAGALAVGLHAESAGLTARLGGVTWERRPIDPRPGPRRLAELTAADALNEAVALAGPQTTGPGGFSFAESHMARHRGEPIVVVDPHDGPGRLGPALDDAARRLDCDLVALVDVGGDVLAHGDERGLASPLCDGVLLAASAHMEVPTVGVLFGSGCDGELTVSEVLARIAEVAAAGGLLGAHGATPGELDALEAAVTVVPTEASAMAVRCGRGGLGNVSIRDGRRRVELSPVGAISFYFSPPAALDSAARVARALVDAGSLDDAQERLAARGLRTELSYEREMAAARG